MSPNTKDVDATSRWIARAAPSAEEAAEALRNFRQCHPVLAKTAERLFPKPRSPLADIQAGWRPVGPQRARKLRKRDETVEWRPELHSMAWLPGGR